MTASPAGELSWLVDDLVDRLAGVGHAVVHSTDGLLLGRTTAMNREDAEHESVAAGHGSSRACESIAGR